MSGREVSEQEIQRIERAVVRETNVVLTPATIAKLELCPDDILVVRSNVNVDAQYADRVLGQIRAILGESRKIIFLSPNLSIEVIAK